MSNTSKKVTGIVDKELPNNFVLERLKSPEDIKGLDVKQLEVLAAELRSALVKKLAAHGGHVGPNLEALEAIVALHYVMDAPKDKLVFDVSHQTYVHKMLTGRIGAFLSPEHYNDVTGFTCPRESEYDIFEIGHTSTAVSLATGLALDRDLRGGEENVVAFVGDGALSGGEAFEGLDFASTLRSNFIVVVNDNQMSIAENHGGLYDNLEELRRTNGTAECNYFRSLGYRYLYVKDGNDMEKLVEAFRAVKGSKEPVVVHLNTEKGHGLPVAEREKERFHFSAPFDPATGALLNNVKAETYVDIFAKHMLGLMRNRRDVVTITAGTPGAIGFDPARREAAGRQFVDVGIAEQTAVAVASGVAKAGGRPVFGVVASFLQRAYDQLSQDVAINGTSPVFVVFMDGVFGLNDVTHLGFFDVPMVTDIPGIQFLEPTNAEEYTAMIDYAVRQTSRPVVVRTPGGPVVHADGPVAVDYTDAGYEVVEHAGDVAVIAAGAFFGIGRKAVELLKTRGVEATLIKPLVMSDIDTGVLDMLADYKTVITLEDNSLDGGMGQKIAAYLSPMGVRVHCLGLPKAFPDRFNAAELLEQQGLTPENVADLAMKH